MKITRKTNPDSSLLTQVQRLAPSIHNLITTRPARITAAMTTHDVTGGYGRGITFYLKLEVLLEQCAHCGETPISDAVLECPRHRIERRFMQIADTEGPTIEKALRKLEAAMTTRERMAA